MLPGEEIYDLFIKGTVGEEEDEDGNWHEQDLISDWHKIERHFEGALQDISDLSNDKAKTSLEAWFDVLKKVMKLHKIGKEAKAADKSGKSDSTEVNDFYIFLFNEEETETRSRKGQKTVTRKTDRVLSFWCFNAGIAFSQIQSLQPRSIILTSGTLTPFNSFQSELKLSFPHTLENPHVIKPEQVYISLVKRSRSGHAFNFNY